MNPSRRSAALNAASATLLAAVVLGHVTCQRPKQPPVRRGSLPATRVQADPRPAMTPERSRGVFPARAEDLPTGPRTRGRPGDWIVQNDRVMAVFRAESGRLVDLALRGGRRDVLHRLDTYVADTGGGGRVYYRDLRAVKVAGAARDALELRGHHRDRDLDLEVVTRVTAPAGGHFLQLDTTVTNRGAVRVLSLAVGDAAYFFNTRWFVPGHGQARHSYLGHAQWMAQTEDGHVAALVGDAKTPMQVTLPGVGGASNPTGRARYATAHLAPGASLRVRRALLLHPGTLAEASAAIQRRLGGPLAQLTLQPAPPPPGSGTALELEVRRQGFPVLRSALRGRTTLTLPAGHRYEARLYLPGAGFGPTVALDPGRAPAQGAITLPWPAFGRVTFRVTDPAGRPLPARIRIAGIAPTPTPDLGDDGTVDGAADVVYTGTGTGARILAPGRYRLRVTRGLEYGLRDATVTVKAGQDAPLAVTLPRELATPGAVSADLHLHAAPSMDSDLRLEGRLTQLAAVGVEYAVATDHNAVTDYAPTAQRLHLERHLLTEVGVEITPRRAAWGHFNLFPLPPGAPVPPFRNRTPREIFDYAKGLPTRPVIQVNHPRMGTMGYFNQTDYAPRHGRAFGLGFETDFHALEVFNGDYLYEPARVERNLREWFTLLNLGHRFTATGNSDAHKLGYQEAGYPRNFLIVAPHADDPEVLRRLAGPTHRPQDHPGTGRADHPHGAATPRPLIDALKQQRVIVSSGPYPTVSLAAPGGGERLVVGETLRGPQVLRLAVHAACWVPVHEVVLVANGKVLKTWTLPARATPGAPGSGGPGAASARGATCESRRFSETLRFAPRSDTWVVLLARGNAPLPVLRGRATTVLGFTNPVWIDADGDGRFQPPGLEKPPPSR